jgi:hypothetical protein
MTRKNIPARIEISCDLCGRVFGSSGTSSKKSAAITLKQDLLDQLGIPVADSTKVLDLCDDCMIKSEIGGLSPPKPTRDERDLDSFTGGNLDLVVSLALGRFRPHPREDIHITYDPVLSLASTISNRSDSSQKC